MSEEYVVDKTDDSGIITRSHSSPELSGQFAFEFEGTETVFNKKVQLAPANIIEEDDL